MSETEDPSLLCCGLPITAGGYCQHRGRHPRQVTPELLRQACAAAQGAQTIRQAIRKALESVFAEPAEDAGAGTPCELHTRYPCWSCMKDQPTLGAGS